MQRFKYISKVFLTNIFLLLIGFISIEIFARISLYGKIQIKKPIKSFVSIGRAIFNINSDWANHLNQGNLRRKPYPYLMFKGAPNKFDHNHLGYRIKEPITDQTINIALFGGSTGYMGDPPIINLVINNLNKNFNKNKFSPINFSVVSSNHNQHLHSIVENFNHYHIDLIIFYGGYNEIFGNALYDPRPGYPYNFNKRNEMNPEMMLLYKHLASYKILENIFPNVYKKRVWSANWNKEIVNNYITTINKARLLSENLTTGRCKIPFIFIYQPFIVDSNGISNNDFKENIYKPLLKYIENSKDGIDLSKVFESNYFFTDNIHINQEGRNIISKAIIDAPKFKNALYSCSIKKI